jgi:hypothetical protein
MTEDHFHQPMDVIREINSRLNVLEADVTQIKAIQAPATAHTVMPAPAPAPALAADEPLATTNTAKNLRKTTLSCQIEPPCKPMNELATKSFCHRIKLSIKIINRTQVEPPFGNLCADDVAFGTPYDLIKHKDYTGYLKTLQIPEARRTSRHLLVASTTSNASFATSGTTFATAADT